MGCYSCVAFQSSYFDFLITCEYALHVFYLMKTSKLFLVVVVVVGSYHILFLLMSKYCKPADLDKQTPLVKCCVLHCRCAETAISNGEREQDSYREKS